MEVSCRKGPPGAAASDSLTEVQVGRDRHGRPACCLIISNDPSWNDPR
jgi:hypothetical protein